MRLIITEKNDAAKKIAGILAKGGIKEDSFLKIPSYFFTDAEGQATAAVGLKGHVVQVDFPPEFSEWRKVEPKALIDAPLVKTETAKSVVRAVKRLAAEATTLIIATDFDREGELIGLEALNLAVEENPKLVRTVKRARFSALTSGEITRAFSHLDQLSEPLARAGEARQDIDLIWGATLTRFVSLATSRLGSQFLSVGRVQTPTLVLVAEREKERRAFVSEPFWVVKVDLDSDGQGFSAVHKEERFTDEARATAVFEKLASPGRVTAVKHTSRKVPRPAPFNTTSFTSAATSLGFSASMAMRIAEDLYMAGHISYPRTDNTVYPPSLDLRETLELLAQGEYKHEAGELLARSALHPSRGDKRTTDHPPIYPTGGPKRGELGERDWRLYELVARRFMATLADEAVMESNRVDLVLSGEPFFARGNRVVQAGWFAFYPYSRQKDLELPPLDQDDLVTLVDKQLEAKETQPPSRYGQGTLIELMEEHNLGTKATRHAIIQNLYDRGYVHGNPVEPTEMGIKLAEALQEFAPRIASPEMTAELEKDMDLISVRDLTKEEVVAISRDLLRQAYGSLEQNREQMAAKIYEGITDDRILGDCPKCGKNKVRVIRSKATKKRFVGCEGYPECDQTYPLPQRGDIIGMDEVCPQCGSPKIKILGGRRPWILCLDPYCSTKAEYREKQAARAARGEKPAAGKTTTRKSAAGKVTATRKVAAGKTTTKAATTRKPATKTGTKAPAKTRATTATRAKATGATPAPAAELSANAPADDES
ncbi:MAG: DNA topoisomerase I [Actinobacteria bacterium RBG_16_64_13]|nr:MAG: DNA topoisomerase I [Actinobacteria bacterium RBG_16_64_13]